jgi:hypothetical protein
VGFGKIHVGDSHEINSLNILPYGEAVVIVDDNDYSSCAQDLNSFQRSTTSISFSILQHMALHPFLWNFACAAKYVCLNACKTTQHHTPSSSSTVGSCTNDCNKSHVFAVALSATFLTASFLQNERETRPRNNDVCGTSSLAHCLPPLSVNHSSIETNLALTSVFNDIQVAMYHFIMAAHVFIGSTSSFLPKPSCGNPPLEILNGTMSISFLKLWGNLEPSFRGEFGRENEKIIVCLKIVWEKTVVTTGGQLVGIDRRAHCDFFIRMAMILHQILQ